MRYRSKKPWYSSFVVRKKHRKTLKNLVRGKLKTCDTSKTKTVYCLKSLTISTRSSILRSITECWSILGLLQRSLNATLWYIFVEHQLYLWEFLQNINLQLCQWLPLSRVLHRYLSIMCYDDVIFNFYYFIAVPIGKTCSMSLMRFNNGTFNIVF